MKKTTSSPQTGLVRTSQGHLLWAPFVLTTLLAFIAGERATSWSWYYEALMLLGVLNLVLAILIVWRTNGRLSAAALVVVGLIIGQFRLIEMAVVILGWSIVGFAP